MSSEQRLTSLTPERPVKNRARVRPVDAAARTMKTVAQGGRSNGERLYSQSHQLAN